MKIVALGVCFTLLLGATAAYPKQKDLVAPLLPSEVKINRCGLHHIALQIGTVPILYGMYHRDKEYEAASQQNFPRAQSPTFGGCVVMFVVEVSHGRRTFPSHRLSPLRQTVKFCPLCRAAEKTWLKRHNYGSNWSKSDRLSSPKPIPPKEAIK